MERITGGEAIVRSLAAHGVDTVFGLPGVQLYGLFDALHKASNEIRTVNARHEQGTAYMALGYAQSTGRPGVYAVVPGPGVLNTTAALSTAYAANAQVLCVTGEIPSGWLGRGRGHLHEIPDQKGVLDRLTRWTGHIDHAAQAPRTVAEAFRRMASGRPGPAAVQMPWDVMSKKDSVELTGPVPADPPPPLDADAIEAAADAIARAKRPMIWVGSGALGAREQVRRLAGLIGAPVASLRGGRGIVPADDPRWADIAAAWELWPDTDCLIALGTRLETVTMRWPERDVPLMRIDIDPREHVRLRPTVGITADSADALDALIPALEAKDARPRVPEADIARARDTAAAAYAKVQPQVDYLAAIRDALPRDGFFVEELCQAGYASWYALPIYEPRTFIRCGYQGTLGFGYATALGVKVGNPDRAVVAVAGDGGFMFQVQELATAVLHGIGVVAVVFNNNAYGNVRRDQETQLKGRVIGSELRNPDFVALARSFGADGYRAESPEALRTTLEAAIAADRPALIEVPVADEVSPWEFIIRRSLTE